MIATVPVEGLYHVYGWGALPLFDYGGCVRIDLGREGEPVGTLVFKPNAVSPNPRATDVTYLLTGAYIKVMGEALFDVTSPELLMDVLREAGE